MRLKIRHNMEVAHRLSLDTGKCLQIHGHGMQIELVLLVEEGPDGMAVNAAHQPLEFGAIKQAFRQYIDSTYDHHLVLNVTDPWAQPLIVASDMGEEAWDTRGTLPGLVIVPGDPTVENLAKWIAEWACSMYRCDVICKLDETKTNGAEVMFHWNNFGAKMVGGAM